MVKRTTDVQYIIVNTEQDALLLENTLIKKHKPRYNVALKDDKTYPWICIKKEPFPRVFVTRRIIRDGSFYAGPFTSHNIMYALLDMINKVFKPRTCNYNLSDVNIRANKFRVCLEYHIGNCFGPCDGHQGKNEYDGNMERIKEILKGDTGSAKDTLKKQMNFFAEQLRFEEAEKVKKQIECIEKHQRKSTVVNPRLTNLDVISIVTDEKTGYVNYLRILNGTIIQSHNLEIKKKLDETPGQLLEITLTECRQLFKSESAEVIVPLIPDFQQNNLIFTLPVRGDKKKLLLMSERNAQHFRLLQLRKSVSGNLSPMGKKLVTSVMADLHLPALPLHIECFDNSNIQGDFPVSACVVFKNGVPSKKDYRLFNLKTVSGPDDFSSMYEVVYRRYKRLTEEKQPLPQLVVIDGGKGQLNAAAEALEKLSIGSKIKIIALAKRMEEIFLHRKQEPLLINKNSDTLKLLQHLRDEAHRFGIKHHRGRRIRETVRSELMNIKGVGEKSVKILLTKFGSVEQIRKCSADDLIPLLGKSKAGKISAFFR